MCELITAAARGEETERIARANQLDSIKFAYFVDAYVQAMIFTDFHHDSEELHDKREADFSDEMNTRILEDCEVFYRENAASVDWWPTQAGHDFWLTRNHHGAGFWDRESDWGKALAERLTEAAHKMGEVEIYVGENGKVYFMG